MPNDWKLEDKWLYAPIIGFLLILLLELINYSFSYTHYPFHTITDLNSYVIRLKLLAQYGYHALVPNLNQGLVLFGAYPPGWAYFTLPFYYITGDVLKANIFSLAGILLLLFITIYYLGKNQGFSNIKILAFFALFMANPVMVDELFRIGRSSALFGWLALAFFFTFLMIYKNRRLNLKFYIFFVLFYTLTLYAHIYHFLLSSLFVAGFFIIKTKKEKLYVVICSAITVLITSNWWRAFSEYSNLRPHRWGIASEFLSSGFFSRQILFSYVTLTSLFVIIAAYFYLKSRQWNKQDFFFLPFLLFPFLVLTEFIAFIPIFNSIPANIYNELFILLGLFFFLGTANFRTLKLVKPILISVLLVFPLLLGAFVFIHIHDSSFETRHIYTPTDKDVMAIIPNIKDPFITLGDGLHLSRLDWGYTDYAIIYHNKSAITDDYSFLVINRTIEANAANLTVAYELKNCTQIKKFVKEGIYSTIMSYDEHCTFWESCGFKAYAKNDNACLIDTKSI